MLDHVVVLVARHYPQAQEWCRERNISLMDRRLRILTEPTDVIKLINVCLFEDDEVVHLEPAPDGALEIDAVIEGRRSPGRRKPPQTGASSGLYFGP